MRLRAERNAGHGSSCAHLLLKYSVRQLDEGDHRTQLHPLLEVVAAAVSHRLRAVAAVRADDLVLRF